MNPDSRLSRSKNATKNIVIFALCAAIMFVQQIVLAGLPNIELVSLLVIVFATTFRYKSLYIIYVFTILEGIFYGFHIWWISYLYVWTILALITILLCKLQSPVIWAVVSGTFGLFFGALCAVPYLFIGGPAMAVAYWVSGIPFDLIHCVSNFFLCLILWKPLIKIIGILSPGLI
jgi:energy-coupling factor transport system substrate-specific component